MKTVIFDMYGVIVKDPEGGLMPFINRTFPLLTHEDVYLHWMKGNVGGMLSLDFFKNIGFEGDLSIIETEYLNTIEIDESFCKIAGILCKYYRLALLSNDFAEWGVFLREKFKINELFDVIIVSGDVKMKKPEPQIFNLMLSKLAQPASDCIYVDDRRTNLDIAQSLGMDTILFNSRNVQYKGKSVKSFNELARILVTQAGGEKYGLA